MSILKLPTAHEYFEEMDRKYPDRHKLIHKECCKQCPSNNMKKAGLVDPESEDFKTCSKEYLAKEVLFVCAWRPYKLCKGICNDYEIDQEYLNKIHAI